MSVKILPVSGPHPGHTPMKAMILAAGRGERMRPLTDRIPKPLLTVAGRPLVVHLILRLVHEGYTDLTMNTAYRGADLEEALEDGQKFGARIRYSREARHSLDTGGGILNALPLLGSDPFLVVNGDIWTDYPFSQLPDEPAGLAHLVLVPNPPHHAGGDFGLIPQAAGAISPALPLPDPGSPGGVPGTQGQTAARVSNHEGERLTFSGMGVYRPALFEGHGPGAFPLGRLLRQAVGAGQVTGERYMGQWRDIGTPERLRELEACRT